jgi:hypothetical protein
MELGLAGVMVGGDGLVDLVLPVLNLEYLLRLLQSGGLLLDSLDVPRLLNTLLPQPVAGPKQARSHQA